MKSVFIFFSLFFLLSLTNYAYAQTSDTDVPTEQVTATPSAMLSTTPEPPEYSLPYPGILPDNPLYFLKVIRDNIVGFLIADPLKKAQFDLLQADKRLQTGVYLLHKDPKQAKLAVTTISKGENYFDQAIAKVNDAKKQGSAVSDLEGKLTASVQKHQQVIHDLMPMVSGDDKKGLVALEQRLQRYQQQIARLEK